MRNVNLLSFKVIKLNFLILSFLFPISILISQTILIDPTGDGGFETGATFAANNWTSVNTATANGSQWFITSTSLTNGSYTFAPTTSRAAFISNNGGTNWRYNTSAAAASSHIYKDVTFPSGETKINLSFRYNVGPAEATWDEMYVYLCPQTLTPLANSPSSSTTTVTWTGTGTATLLGTFRNLVAGAGSNSGNINIPGSVAGNTGGNSPMRLVFTWKNDGGGGTEPPAAIDDVSLTSVAPVPICNSLGTYTIDNTLANTVPSGGFNFSSFTNAINYLNSDGICGPLTLNVVAGQTFTEDPPALTATGTLTNQIIFQKSGAGANPVLVKITGVSTTTDFGFCISGGDYITFDGIDVNSSTATTSTLNLEFGYLLRNASATNGAQNNTIKNCAITLNKNFVGTGSSGCIYSSVSTSQGAFTPTNATGANSNNKFYNLTLNNAQNGLYLVGNSSFPDLNNEIGVVGAGCQAARNTISNMGGVTTFTSAYGIRCDGQSSIKIFNNDISNIRSNQATTAGILLLTFAGTNEIYANKVGDISNSGSTSSTSRAVGIELQNSSGTPTARVYNNVIFDIKSPFTGSATASRYAIGIFANNTVTATISEIDNNSVYLSVASGTPTYSSTCFEIANSGTAVHKVRGNIFVNAFPAQGATAKHFCWVSTAAAAIGGAGTVSNHNDLFILNDQSTSGHVGRGSTTNYNTLANWQAITAAPDANSVSTNPMFTSTTDLHSSASALNAFSGYTPQAWVTTDIECADRSTASPSDLGAYVINTCSVADGGTISPATQNKCAGQTSTMTSTGATIGSGITYQWKVSSTSGSGYVNVTGGSGATSTSYTSDALTAGTYYYVLETTCSTGPTTDLSNELTITVNSLPTVTVLPSSASLCSPGGSPVTLTAGGASTYSWSPTSGLAPTSGSPVDASPSVTTAYTVTGTDGNGCTNTAMSTITVVGTPQNVTALATPNTICSGDISNLTSSAFVQNTASLPNSYMFTASSGTFTPLTGGNIIVGGNADSYFSGILPIGFNFIYNGTTYSNFYFSSNGFISFTSNVGTGNTNGLATASSPVIAPLWDDLDGNGPPGTASYLTTGSVGNRILTVEWLNWEWNWQSSTAVISFQVKIYEIDGRIEFSYFQNATAVNSGSASIGISGAIGNYVSLNNSSTSPTPSISSETTSISTKPANGQIYIFTPPSLTLSYAWTPAIDVVSPSNQNTATNALSTTTNFIVTASNGGCSAQANAMVTISTGAAIISEPISDSKCVGQTATFTVGATGPSLTYQWRKGGVDIPIGGNASAGTETLSLTNVMAGDAAVYDVVVTSTCGSPVMSNGSSILTVNAIPTATASNDGPKCVGSDLNLFGSHVGGSTFAWTGPASFSSNNQNPTRSGLILSHSGTYTFTATSTEGCTSDPATTVVTINASPTAVSISPASAVLCTSSPPELLSTTGGSINGSLSFSSGTINLAITDNSSTGVSNTLSVSGIPAGATIDSIIVTFNISHEFAGDVEVNIEAPNGQITNLMADRGGSSILGFANTRTSSDITKPAFSSGTAPFSGTFRADLTAQVNLIASPAITTQVFSNLFSTPNGSWKIRVYDDASGDVGTLVNWSVKIAYTAPSSIIWSPAAGLYTDAGATMDYTGGHATSLYAKPAATQTYTVTASSAEPVTFDGVITEAAWGNPLATSAGGPAPGFGAGHELNALYVQGNHSDINLAVAGNVQDGNRILVFIDSKSGGYSDGSFGRSAAPQGVDDFNSGTTFDAGFEADYCLVIGTNGAHDNFFFDLYTLSAGGGPLTYLGDISNEKIGADPINGSNTRGFEIAISKALLGYTSGSIKVFAMYISDGGYLSNQFLTVAGVGDGNYADGVITFSAAMPNPVTIPLANLQNYCTSSAMVTVSIEGTVVKSTSDAGFNTLRSVYGCITEGGTITYDQPTTVTTVLTAPLDFTKSVTIQGLDSNNRPEITLPAVGSAISAGKVLTLQDVDIKSTAPTQTFSGPGDVLITGTTVGKQ